MKATRKAAFQLMGLTACFLALAVAIAYGLGTASIPIFAVYIAAATGKMLSIRKYAEELSVLIGAGLLWLPMVVYIHLVAKEPPQ